MGHGGSMSEALRLADALERGDSYESHPCVVYGWVGNDDPTTEAAAELRRLHAENERLREALRLIAAQDQGCGGRVTEAEAWRSAQSLALLALR